jgi:glycosyltransferase involved in cell wall biosynthesis
VRIGIDMLGVQSPDSRLRGVGRYGRDFLAALVALDPIHEYVLYAHKGLPTDQFPDSANAEVRPLPLEPGEPISSGMDRLAQLNPDGLDGFLMLNPFELMPGYAPAVRPLSGLSMMAVVYDLIPFLFPERYLSYPAFGARFYRRLDRVRRYDLLMAISESTRSDCLRLLGLPPERVVTISSAANSDFFKPDRGLPFPAKTIAILAGLGIIRPYVFCVSGMDERKNLWGLIDAFRRLPIQLRAAHQLVLTCELKPDYEARIRCYAEERGVLSSLVLTGAVPDTTLRLLYQRCAAFAFPSLYEGFGLPILEAMHCGAAVIAGNNSSQVEVVGESGLLANAADPAELAEGLERILSDPSLASSLRRRAVIQASRFDWTSVATRALNAMTRIHGPVPTRRHRYDRGRTPRPRVAVFSPWPPKSSGISDYAALLVNELQQYYVIDLYHEPGYVPEPGLKSGNYACHDTRMFEARHRILNYRAVLHQMGNSFYHGFVYDAIAQYGGIVTLHDFCLSGFHFWRAHLEGDPLENLRREIQTTYPERYDEFLPQLRRWTEEPGGFQDALARRGLYLNREVFEQAEAVVVHSPWCLEEARKLGADYAAKTVVIPHGSHARLFTAAEKAEIRKRYGLPPNNLIVGSFGILTQGKMNVEAICAFAALAREDPTARFLLVGADWEQGQAQRKVDELGLSDRVRFLGRQSAEAFDELLGAVDIGISLRRPPTYGETSGALLHMLRNGIPTIVNDVGTFSGYPDTVVRKVRIEAEGIDGLAQALCALARDRLAREALGRAAYRHVAEQHAWPRAGALYAELIERLHAARAKARREQRSFSLMSTR